MTSISGTMLISEAVWVRTPLPSKRSHCSPHVGPRRRYRAGGAGHAPPCCRTAPPAGPVVEEGEQVIRERVQARYTRLLRTKVL